MILLSFVIGLLVIKFKPNYNLKTVFESNARYYPHINDETVLKKINKPVPAVQEQVKSSAVGTSAPAGEAAAGSPAVKEPAASGKKPEKVHRRRSPGQEDDPGDQAVSCKNRQ